jgi:hypothetical protein
MGFKEFLKSCLVPQITLPYLGGCPLVKGSMALVAKTGKPREITINQTAYQVVSVTWDENRESNAGKAIAGTLTGGLIAGVPGAIVGAAVSGSKDKSIARLTVQKNGGTYNLLLRCTASDFKTLSQIVYS